jgi:2-keto-4-pentenoate hydratase/2-oxohepta-3-ene-1,7-dioic acid hydratase in catechol pathway
MRLVSYNDGRVGYLASDQVIPLPARTMQDALSYVFGYTGLLDITMRGGEDRSTRKSFDTFTPMGPVLSTADEFGDPDDVELRCWVSGDLRQKASTRDLIWDVARLVSYASSVTTLYPGDVITTGTPAGVGPLIAGDTIRLEVSGLGLDLTAQVAADVAIASPTSGHNRGPVPPPGPAESR